MIEILIVMGIIGLILASSVPALSSYSRQVRLKTATREVIGLLSLARSQAIGSRTAKTVLIDPEHREVVIESDRDEPRRARLPTAIAMSVETQGEDGPSEGESRLIFQPSGTLAGRSTSLILSNGSHTETIRISATTGAISVN